MPPISQELRYFLHKTHLTAPAKLLLCILTCPFCCFCYPCRHFHLGCGNAKQGARERKRRESRAVKLAHREREFRTRRPLSVDEVEAEERGGWRGGKRRTKGQMQSMLMGKVPVEVRVMIWEHVLGGASVTVMYRGLYAEHACYDRIAGVDDAIDMLYGAQQDQWSGREQLRDAHALLRTCRLIYTEAIDVLYASNDFIFPHTDDLPQFHQGIPRSHFQSITSLTLIVNVAIIDRLRGNWHEVFGFLADTDLSRLRLHLIAILTLTRGGPESLARGERAIEALYRDTFVEALKRLKCRKATLSLREYNWVGGRAVTDVRIDV